MQSLSTSKGRSIERGGQVFLILREKGCPNNIYRLLFSYLNDRKATIVTSNGKIERKMECGCPQGSISGPSLWNVFYNSLLQTNNLLPKDSIILGYADDTLVLLKHGSRERLQEMANYAMDIIYKWSTENKVVINFKKCNSIVFGRKKPLQKTLSIKINNVLISQKSTINYLGVVFDSSLTWKEHVSNVCKKAQLVLHSLNAISAKGWGLGNKATKIIYSMAVEPIVTYAAAAWGMQQINIILRKNF